MVDEDDVVTTGVARGRDRLNSATSTSAIKENDIISIAPRSMGELFRNIPGIRVEASGGEANNDYTVRGLPLVNDGSKYIQLQEDGLPVLEFGDLQGLNPDNFLRVDLNVAQVESIRGGSASTFASNAPGGVINLISKTGEVEGGSVMGTIGVDYESYRTDFDYGGRLGDGWRFHVGGFYREGEGPRATGYNAMRGGQMKFNVTKQFDSGYIRVYAKVLDDRTPTIINTPLLVTGTNADPKFADPVGTDSRRGSLLSLNLPASLRLGASGTPTSRNLANGNRAKAKSLGFDAQFNLGEWTVANRFRYADQSLLNTIVFQSAAAPAAALAAASAGPGGAFTYAAGPRAGQALDANGNRLAVLSFNADFDAPDVSNMTNDLRVSRVWDLGGGNLTTTAGMYRSRQEFVSEAGFTSYFQDAVSNGTAVPLALRTGSGIPLTQNGVLIYGSPGAPGNAKNIDLNYQITAPFASFNFAAGKIAIGGSVRWDNVRVRGNVINDSATKRFDMNGDGVISAPENRVAFIPVGVTAPVRYDHDYVSYSLSANYRVSESFSMFGRYSRGGRAGADKILFTPAISGTTGDLINRSAGHDTVRQAELGLKYRKEGLVLNLTGFYALTDETNSQIVNNAATGQTILVAVTRSYKAYGLEFEGGIRRGPFSLTAHATYTEAEIDAAEVPALVGNTPRHQPKLMFGLRPQYDSDFFSVGANVVGITKSFAQDVNQLVMPGYTTVGMFAQVRPMEGLEFSLNASNLFNTRGITDILDGALPASGVVMARTIYGRTISASARFFF
ncbi:TonB-dependent receptor domain-containing protein [Sphingomonas sp. 35-24ZXX]|uniref:TonB-dependent receptor domain-containing protein n=1 Tax=Sphingomonas sp. 35-24ZXX TaxID=1545915 RepID=UPI000A78AF03|nr:TonB-dependent receptor [Sphingomonas sp. 35-24ZXX]